MQICETFDTFFSKKVITVGLKNGEFLGQVAFQRMCFNFSCLKQFLIVFGNRLNKP